MKELDNCGCCEGLSKETPFKIYNRPNLKAVAYRVGDHNKFMGSLLTALSDNSLSALSSLTSRDNNDFTIALLDAWAVVADVLTFYQERIANESYLGTATEQFSIVELARLIGYELRPGVAASTPLAFTIEEATMVLGQIAVTGNIRGKEDIASTIIPVGSKVQSIPGPDEEPQTFETIEKIEARPEWNAIKPRLTQPQTDFSKIIIVKGTTNDLKSGDVILINEGNNPKKVRKIVKVVLDEEAKTTTLSLNNPQPVTVKESVSSATQGTLVSNGSRMLLNKNGINEIATKRWLEEDIAVLTQTQGWSKADMVAGLERRREETSDVENEIFVFRKRALPFGYNALKYVDYFDDHGNKNLTPEEHEYPNIEKSGEIYLESAYEQIVQGSYVAVKKEGKEESDVYKVIDVDVKPRTAYGISAKSTLISIDSTNNWWTDTNNNLSDLRSIVIYAQSEQLMLAESPIDEPIKETKITLDRFFPNLIKNVTVVFFGERIDLPGTHAAEFRILNEVYLENGFTTIVLDKPLDYQYIRKTVTINANIAHTTHGETVKEVLGSGDASKVFQKFILKQPPLTFTSASTPSGTQSTLEIRVNDILWHEVPSLFERKANEHIYITRQDDLGKTTITFGDGKNGTRLPTGQENIHATYRRGIGSKGLLKAYQLSQLISRPLGVKAVTNPLKTAGAQDKEVMADARRNATLTIFTLGRIVSLQDYEDFARSFAGIAKSLATWTWQGQKRNVYLTVAGYNGAVIDSESSLYKNLIAAIQNSGIPDVPIRIQSYTPLFFRVIANVAVHPDYEADKVFFTIEAKLREQFSFTNRSFGQSVAYSEVITIMQKVAGVIAVDIDFLYRSHEASTLEKILFASSPSPLNLAELLTLDPRPLNLTQML